MKSLHFRVIILALAWLFITPLGTRAQTPEAGGRAITIEGQVTHAVTGEPAPAGLLLMLHTYEGRSMTNMTDGATDEQGRFRFANVQTDAGHRFEVMVRYRGVTYFSKLVEPQPDQIRLDLPVKIYETTTDTSSVGVKRLHLLMDFAPGTVQISQVFVLSNDGDRTVRTHGQEGLRFHLPAGATDVSFEGDRDGKRFIQERGAFLDTEPVVPGEETMVTVVRYTLPYTDQLDLDIPVDYPTTNVSLLLPEQGVVPKGSGWQAGQEMLIQKHVVQIYDYLQTPLSPKGTLHVAVAGQPALATATPEPDAATTPPAEDNRKPVVLLGAALALVLVGAGGVWWWRGQGDDVEPDPALDPLGDDAEPEALESIPQVDVAPDDPDDAEAIAVDDQLDEES